MRFDLTDEQSAIFEMAKDFAAEKLAPHAIEWDQQAVMPTETLREAAELGMAAIYVGEEHGGSGLTRLDSALIFEGLSMGCPSIAAFLSIHNMVAWMIDLFGDPAQRARWVPELTSMRKIGAYCLTEPGSGSDAAALRTRAVRDPDGWRISGTKAFISGGGFSDLYIVMARTGEDGPKGVSSFIIERPSEGLSFGAQEKKMGWNAQPTAQVQLDNCLVPAQNLLGREGDGFTYAMKGLDGGRINIAACALGAAQTALDKSIAYVRERQAFGVSLDKMQSIQFKLADMETELQAARIFLRQAAWMLDQNAPDAPGHSAMVKRFVTDAAFRVADEALQIHGGYGYLADYGLEKIVRDLRVHRILEGTNEIMRLIVARALLKERN